MYSVATNVKTTVYRIQNYSSYTTQENECSPTV